MRPSTRRGFLQSSAATSAFGSQQWTPKAREYVQDWQEKRWSRVGRRLGLGLDPRAAYDRLARRFVPVGNVSIAAMKAAGVGAGLTVEEWQYLDKKIAETHLRYSTLPLPTSYEDPNRYATMAMAFDTVHDGVARSGRTLDANVLLATSPLGDLNAQLVVEPKTLVPIIFFNHGLFQFLFDFSLVTGWAIAPLSGADLRNDSTLLLRLQRLPSRPSDAPEYLYGLLSSYASEGSPRGRGSLIPHPADNLELVMRLISHMESFAIAHELAHVNNMEKEPSPQDEFDADAYALDVVTTLAAGSGSPALGYWACDLMLFAFDTFYRSLGLLAFPGRRLRWIRESHPDPFARRQNLRRIWLSRERGASGRAGLQLAEMSDAVFQQLREVGELMWLAAQTQQLRPSPVWKELIAATLAPA